MKILHLISQHPESTGSGYYLQNIIGQAEKRGHENYLVAGISGTALPHLVCISPTSCRFVHFEHGELNFPIPGMSDVMPYPSSRFKDLSEAQIKAYEQAFSKTLQDAVDSFSPDLIHSHHLWIASSTARRLFPDIPLVTSCHSTCLRQYAQCPHLRSRVFSPCGGIDAVLALSRDQKGIICEQFQIEESKISIVGGGLNDTLFTLSPKSAPPPIKILYAGKLSYAKGVDWLLRTFNKLQGRGFHLSLAGSGTGEEERLCLRLAEQNNDVTVHGMLSQQQLAYLMSESHIFILPSFYEGLPLVLLEALASGCRIITTDLSGCRELLVSADSDIVEFVNLPALQTIDSPAPKDIPMLEKLLENAIQNMASKVRSSPSPDSEYIRQVTMPYNWKTVFSRIEEVYKKVLSS